MKKVLAIDMGATSIRGILAYVENGLLKTKEVMRTTHEMIQQDGSLVWDWDHLLSAIVDTIHEYHDEIDSIGIDGWGVDCALLDHNGAMIGVPHAYRDPNHTKAYEEFGKIMSDKEVYLKTGNQVMGINTLYQLYSIKQLNKEDWEKCEHILMLPDMFKYMIGGEMSNEETILSTSQLYDLRNKELSEDILKVLGLKKENFPHVVHAGTKCGNTKNSKIESLRQYDIDVYAVCGHDTASAVLVTEAFQDDKTLFLSCGTWSLIGSVVDQTIITEESFEKDLTNELGYDSKAMFFSNITGLYLLEKYKQQLEKRVGHKISYDDITDYVSHDENEYGYIDVDDPVFAQNEFDAKTEIEKHLASKHTGKDVLEHEYAYFKIIYQSLVKKYVETVNAIKEMTHVEYTQLHMIGGGVYSTYLVEEISKALSMPIIAGPVESTALGNILVQLCACGEVESMRDGIDMIKRSESIKVYDFSLKEEER